MYCLETQHVSHRFSKTELILNDISLRVAQGCIYGFLGPNGAGKTTTLKLILGLLKKQQGQISVFGMPFEKDRTGILKKIGSLIESPSVYSQLTALENLQVLQKTYQCPKERMQQVLDLVGLSDTRHKKAGQFSLGMKQRLSIAIALLHHPALLILDEPTNGLDPNGIIEMRELLKKLNREQGITIVISSHLLAEIEKLVTHVGVIHKGSMLFQGTLDELMTRQQASSTVVIETNDLERSATIIRTFHEDLKTGEGKLILPPSPNESIAAINRALVQAGIAVYGITTVKNDLEAVFMDLTNQSTL